MSVEALAIKLHGTQRDVGPLLDVTRQTTKQVPDANGALASAGEGHAKMRRADSPRREHRHVPSQEDVAAKRPSLRGFLHRKRESEPAQTALTLCSCQIGVTHTGGQYLILLDSCGLGTTTRPRLNEPFDVDQPANAEKVVVTSLSRARQPDTAKVQIRVNEETRFGGSDRLLLQVGSSAHARHSTTWQIRSSPWCWCKGRDDLPVLRFGDGDISLMLIIPPKHHL